MIEPPNVQTESMSSQIGFMIVNVGVDSAGVVGLKLIKVSHSECQFARTCCISVSSSEESRHSRYSLSQLRVGVNLFGTKGNPRILTRR